ncbi:uncharacterized protein LOC107878091 isoform X2 [Capsicum annuum]|uniref:uncharacterized protein LOC107878091 isoform X2 n=1 Tax=Capsicum annuum TaxID=4072 RepID=UPI001FB0D568|nr:uncharacterized protein LOC107878091 isoform X2 [Capsicum annuum]
MVRRRRSEQLPFPASTASPRKPRRYNLEYKGNDDDSWYSVRIVIKGKKMTVKYKGYPKKFDVVFDSGEFKSKEEVDEMVRRFRSVSPQLQDSECGRLKEGMVVCVGCNAFGGEDMLFYDAVIEAIHNVDHSFSNREECLCTFVVSWLHGPKKGQLTSTRIEGMCIIESVAQVGPKIAPFLKLVNQNLGKSSCMLTSASKYEISASEGSSCENGGSNLSIISSFEGINSAKSIVDVTTGATNSIYSRLWEDDKDLGVQAYILPSLSMPYARGILVVDSEDTRQKILQFLDSLTHLIVSSTGRPLVITERNLRHGMIKMWSGSYEPQDMCVGTSLDKDLMVVHSGTEAYETAKQLKDLFQEFTSHQRELYKKFSVEEMTILQEQQQQQLNQITDV